MIHRALGRPVPIELTADPRLIRRVRRLAAVSSVALGLIAILAAATLEVPDPIIVALFAGWLAMPTVLVVSLRRPEFRYGLAVPATLVTFGLGAIVIGWLPDQPIAAVGWVLILAGVLLGGLMGLWFWFRVVPVPARFDQPNAPGRSRLIAVHVGLVIIGLILVVVGTAAS